MSQFFKLWLLAVLIPANAVFVISYVLFSALTWAEWVDGHRLPFSGEAFVWFGTAFPVLVLSLLFNIAYLATFSIATKRLRKAIAATALLTFVWWATLAFDIRQH